MWSKISNSKAAYMVLAIVCSIALWLYVDIVEAPKSTTTVSYTHLDVYKRQVLIRSHGESRTVYQTLEEQGNPVLDATCPNVAHIHKLVAEAERKGRVPVIIGAPNHPEVLAIAGWCDQPVVLELSLIHI